MHCRRAVLTTAIFQLVRSQLGTPEATAGWSLELPPTGHGVLSLVYDLHVASIDWRLAGYEALLAAVTAFVPNVLGKLLQVIAPWPSSWPYVAPSS